MQQTYIIKPESDFEYWKEFLVSLSRFYSSKPEQLPQIEIHIGNEVLKSYISDFTPDTYELENSDLFIKDLKRFYGTTQSIGETGYILPDGTCLDFSGRHLKCGILKWNYAEGHKGMTHDAILGINKDGYCLTDHYRNLFWSSLSFTNAILKYSGAVRVSIDSEDVDPFIQIYQPLTKQQIISLTDKYNKTLILDCTTFDELPVYDDKIQCNRSVLFSLNDLIIQEYNKVQENGITD